MEIIAYKHGRYIKGAQTCKSTVFGNILKGISDPLRSLFQLSILS